MKTLSDLNNYLFEQLEKLNDETLEGEKLDRELRKADTSVKIAEKIIQNGELAFRTMQHMDQYGYGAGEKIAPALLSFKEK